MAEFVFALLLVLLAMTLLNDRPSGETVVVIQRAPAPGNNGCLSGLLVALLVLGVAIVLISR